MTTADMSQLQVMRYHYSTSNNIKKALAGQIILKFQLTDQQ